MTYDPKDKIRSALMEHYERRVYETVEMTVGETPIENVLFVAINAICDIDHIVVRRYPNRNLGLKYPDIYAAVNALSDGIFVPCIAFESQHAIENYRVDFLFMAAGNSDKIVVECDGHDFHERTKAQAERDRKRDRRLQELGYKVFRFTGSEIWRDPMACARQVVNALGVAP